MQLYTRSLFALNKAIRRLLLFSRSVCLPRSNSPFLPQFPVDVFDRKSFSCFSEWHSDELLGLVEYKKRVPNFPPPPPPRPGA